MTDKTAKMSIKSYFDELASIRSEIKRNNAKNRALRQRAKVLETNISEFLAEKGQHGVKYKGQAIVLHTKERRPPKKKKEKEESVLSLLEELGVRDPKSAYDRLKDVQKGDPIEKKTIKFTKIPKK